ncbi:hypothetical protein BGX38DRAFT_1245353 [Terfezia claveryi]|nr:hypothetical protein BGX38DRAFT_1245353 [Terfezia claveryi]
MSEMFIAALIAETRTLLERAPEQAFKDILLERLVSKVTQPYIKRCTDLESENQKLQAENQKLQSENQKLETEKREFETEKREFETENQKLQWQFEKRADGIKRDLQNRYAADLNEHQSRIIELNAKLAVYTKNDHDFRALQSIAEAINDQFQPGHFLQVPYNRTTRHVGSVTRAKAWARAIDDPNSTVPPSSPRTQLESRVSEDLMRLARQEEIHIDYINVVRLLTDYFNEQSILGLGTTHIIDTHRQRFLDDRAPDIVIQRYTSSPDKFNVAAVIDLKGFGNNANNKLGTYDNFGQILDYLTILADAQEGRKVFLGLLTNLKDAYLLKLSTGILKGRSRRTSARGAHTSKLVQYRKVPIQAGLKHLYMELTSAEANPPAPSFSDQAGTLVRVLQRSSRSVVAIFCRKEIRVVVKTAPMPLWIPGIVNEINLLRSLQGLDKPLSIPTLVYDTLPPDTTIARAAEFGIQPVGQPISLDLFQDSESFLRCLEDLLVALQWVHSNGIVHRDVRGDNFIVFVHNHYASPPVEPDGKVQGRTNQCWRGVLIDFDRAVELGKECHYEGGYICCPIELLRASSSSGNLEGRSATAAPNDDSDGDESMVWHDLDNDTDLDGSIEGSNLETSPLSQIFYVPKESHDYLGFVLLVNTLIFPFTLQGYSYNRVETPNSMEQKRLLRLWAALDENAPWRQMIAAAERVETDMIIWREMLGMLQWL